MKNFLDTTFNLAGFLRGFFLGLGIGLVLCFLMSLVGGFRLIQSEDAVYFVFCLISFLPAIILAILGARKQPVAVENGTKKWVGSTKSILNFGSLTGGIQDSIFPEKITIRKFLLWLIIIVFILCWPWIYSVVSRR